MRRLPANIPSVISPAVLNGNQISYDLQYVTFRLGKFLPLLSFPALYCGKILKSLLDLYIRLSLNPYIQAKREHVMLD